MEYSWSTLLWHRCYYPHRSRDALSPVCRIFFYQKITEIKKKRNKKDPSLSTKKNFFETFEEKFQYKKKWVPKFLKHLPSGPMLSISRKVEMSVCLSVCLSVCSLLRYRLTVFLPPLPEIGCQIFSEIQNPWGKTNGKKWSNIWTILFGSGLKLPSKKKSFFCWFCLTKHGGNHALDVFEFLRF